MAEIVHKFVVDYFSNRRLLVEIKGSSYPVSIRNKSVSICLIIGKEEQFFKLDAPDALALAAFILKEVQNG